MIVKYHLRQIRKSKQHESSSLEKAIITLIQKDKGNALVEFSSLHEDSRKSLVAMVMRECSKYVLGALSRDLGGMFFSFDRDGNGIYLSPSAYEFLFHYHTEIERINYYSWAKFLEEINDDTETVRILDKLEMSTPRRKDLSPYRYILQKEFEENTCFYCGRKLISTPTVDHFIPWKFTKDDRLWNFVLACQTCNSKKNDKLPSRDVLDRIIIRNGQNIQSSHPFVIEQFSNYDSNLYIRMWKYAKQNGFKEFIS